MSMEYFKVGDLATPTVWTDLTTYVNKRDFSVNKTEIFEQWEDGDRALHRKLVRTRIQGRLTLGFDSSANMSAFLTLLSGARRPDLAWNVQVWCQNTGTTESCTAFLDVAGTGLFDELNSRQWVTLDVDLTEV